MPLISTSSSEKVPIDPRISCTHLEVSQLVSFLITPVLLKLLILKCAWFQTDLYSILAL